MSDLGEIATEIAARLVSLHGQEARWRYFQRAGGPMFAWTVEPYHLREGGVAEGRYESLVYVPRKRRGRVEHWEVAEGSRSLHALRRDAKARALRLFRAHEAGDPAPWR